LTLVVAVRCSDGAVLASDSRRSRGPADLGTPVTKLFASQSFIWGWAGEEDAAQEFTLRLSKSRIQHPSREDGKRLIDLLVSEVREELGGPNAAFDVLAAWQPPGSRPVVLKAFSHSRSVFIENYDAIGLRQARELANFAMTSMNFVDLRNIGVKQGRVVAYKCLRDVIRVDPQGVGGEVQMASIDSDGARVLDDQDVEAERDAAVVWEAKSRAALGVPEPLPAEGARPERGVRRPEPEASG
jgi:proteasome beta subunit